MSERVTRLFDQITSEKLTIEEKRSLARLLLADEVKVIQFNPDQKSPPRPASPVPDHFLSNEANDVYTAFRLLKIEDQKDFHEMLKVRPRAIVELAIIIVQKSRFEDIPKKEVIKEWIRVREEKPEDEDIRIDSLKREVNHVISTFRDNPDSSEARWYLSELRILYWMYGKEPPTDRELLAPQQAGRKRKKLKGTEEKKLILKVEFYRPQPNAEKK